MAERSPPIGIDLGTTKSCVGVWREGWVEIIPNQLGNRTTPSCVAFTDTLRYIGEDAQTRAIKDPCNTILNVKRLIGNRFSSTDVELLPFEVVSGPGGKPMISVQYQREAKQLSAIEISSMVLRNLCDTAEDFLKCLIKNVVISVPACFNDSQRLATVYAANIAGLSVKRIINEPTAAAIAYGLDNIVNNNRRKKKKNNILIFDLGGGTLDVSILTIENGYSYKVKATRGDAHLGGKDFDDLLIKHCIDELKKKDHLNVNSSPKALAKLRTSCETAKKALSVVEETQIEIDSLLPGIDFDYCITRAKFEELSEVLFNRCIDVVGKCLLDAKMYKSSIHDIVPIGGSTRIPKVQQRLQEFFGKDLSTRINPDEAVARGAAIHAAILSGNKVPSIVHDITTHSLGIDIPKNVFMIPRRTAIPITVVRFLPAVAQIKYPIKVYEGESPKIQDNKLLGEFTMMNNVNPVAPDAVYFKVDENGIFSIEAEEKVAGHGKKSMMQITRDFMPELSKEDIGRMATEAKKLKSEEEKYRKKLEAKNTLEKLINHLSKSNPNKSKLDLVAEEKIEDASRKTMQWLEENAQAIRDEFVDEYREHVNCLEKTLDGAGVGNMHSSPTPSTGTLTNSDTILDHLVSRVEKLNELFRNSAESSHLG
ncbi:hypothetical protein AAC387_Pa09g1892 [Persea americana]